MSIENSLLSEVEQSYDYEYINNKNILDEQNLDLELKDISNKIEKFYYNSNDIIISEHIAMNSNSTTVTSLIQDYNSEYSISIKIDDTLTCSNTQSEIYNTEVKFSSENGSNFIHVKKENFLNEKYIIFPEGSEFELTKR